MEKAVEYTELRQPFLINDLQTQFNLQDRRIVYKILQQNGIETPRYAVCVRGGGNCESNFLFVGSVYLYPKIFWFAQVVILKSMKTTSWLEMKFSTSHLWRSQWMPKIIIFTYTTHLQLEAVAKNFLGRCETLKSHQPPVVKLCFKTTLHYA